MTLAIDYQLGKQKIADADYHALPFCSKHALDVIDEWSPMHLMYRRANPEPPTPAMKFGSAFHTFMLEAEEFDARHPVMTQCVARKADGGGCTNDGKVRVGSSWLCGVHAKGKGGVDMPGAITEAQLEQIKAMAQAIKYHRAASSVLEAEGENEAAILWKREVLGDGWSHDLTCKLKADILRPSWEMVADIKTCDCASQTAFERSVADFNYHRQAAFYQDGCRAVGIDIKHFVFICVEKSAPYGVAVYRLLDDAIGLGREENERLLTKYAACERNNDWFGYENEFKDVSLPVWAFRRKLNELQN